MSTGPIDVTVYLDGYKAASTGADYLAGEPTVLSGLALDWGRKTAVDQPGASALTLSIARNQPGDILEYARAGVPIQLTATGTIYQDPTVSTFLDPEFDTTPAGDTPGNVLRTNSTAVVAVDGTDNVLRIDPVNRARTASVVLAPAPYSSSPAAWDAIPTTSVAQTWTANISIQLAAGQTARMRPVLFANPTGASYTVGEEVSATSVTGGPVTLTVSFDVDPGEAGRWVGVALSVFPTGASWQATPGTWAAQAGAWRDRSVTYVDTVNVIAPGDGLERTVLMFDGRVTDLEVRFERDWAGGGATVLDLVARDFTADLDNNRIGDEPWLMEAASVRVPRILELAGDTVTALIDPSIGARQLTWRDVDSQPAGGLVREIAASGAGIAWSAAHQTLGHYYWLEDPSTRPSLYVLELSPTSGLVEIVSTATIGAAIVVPAGYLLEVPVRFVQDVTDIVTRVDVVWNEQTVDDDGNPDPTERHVAIVDAELEAQWGQRGVSLTTQLALEADAVDVAGLLLARTRFTTWRVAELTWDTGYPETFAAGDDMQAALDLLDGTIRIGHPLTVEQMPAWSPIPGRMLAYIEGGKYTFDGGRWQLGLYLTDAGLGNSATWEELDPAWAWQEFDPGIAWADLVGVAADDTATTGGGTP